MTTKTTTKKTSAKKTRKPERVKTKGKGASVYPKIFEEFVVFMALPKVIQKDIYGFYTQTDFAKHNQIPEPRLSEWKRTDKYTQMLSKVRKQYFRNKIGEVVEALYKEAIKNPRGADAKVLLDYVGEIQPESDNNSPLTKEATDILTKLNKLIPN